MGWNGRPTFLCGVEPGGGIMPLVSIWDYLRQRTRDAVLAGFQDALEVAEQNDQGGSEYEAARKLRHRLAAMAAREAPPGRLPPVAVADGRGAARPRPPRSTSTTASTPGSTVRSPRLRCRPVRIPSRTRHGASGGGRARTRRDDAHRAG